MENLHLLNKNRNCLKFKQKITKFSKNITYPSLIVVNKIINPINALYLAKFSRLLLNFPIILIK